MFNTPPKLNYFGISNAGLKRANNEDSFHIDPEHGYCLVADGMGGAAAGEIASQVFSETAKEVFNNAKVRSKEEIMKSVQDTFRLANGKILSHVQKHPAHRGMGCTAELMAFTDENFVLGHIGDSRTYRFRNGLLRQLTQDHSLIQDQVNKGILSKQDARKHPNRNVILRAVGISYQIVLDLIRGKTHPKDRFLLCSDGLTDMVEDTVIQQILYAPMTLKKKVENLIELALSGGGADNVTVVLVETN